MVLWRGAVDGVGCAPAWWGVLRRGAVHGRRRRRRGARGWEWRRGGQWMGAQGTVVPVGVGWCSAGVGGGVGMGLK